MARTLPDSRPGSGRWLALVATLAVLGCSPWAHAADVDAGRHRANPLERARLYVDPGSPAAAQAARWRAEGRLADAAAMAHLARRPAALWITAATHVESRVRAAVTRAARRGRWPVLVAYFIPHRNCGGLSPGGASSAAAYRDYVRAFSRGIGGRRAVVIVEPDAIAQSVAGCLVRDQAVARSKLLRFAVRTLARRRRALVYLDAGNVGWVRPASRLARPLRESGVKYADGFALNVSNFFTSRSSVRYGRALSSRLRGAHFVVDTSRNGNGPSRGGEGPGPSWCNPPGRSLGRDPTTHTGRSMVDAYLWIKVPGESDGACRPGAPPAGQWWPEYALGLVRSSR